jgi:predicted ATP-binding protein involved in virulence
MFLKTLTLTHVRAFKQAEFAFRPGMNLIVGINGVGKSTVLDALRILLSQALPKFSQSRNKPLNFEISDLTIDATSLNANLIFEVDNTELGWNVMQYRERYVPISDSTGKVRLQTYSPGDREVMVFLGGKVPPFKKVSPQPLAIYFSPRRALASTAKSSSKTKGLAAAFTDALAHRELRLTEFADWWLAQIDLAAEGAPNAQRHLDSLAKAITNFLETCADIQVWRETYTHQNKNGQKTQKYVTQLTIDKADTILDLRQLSDGERGILAIVLDLARRLSQANPNLEDPLQAEAVVLIDELDLHLHPKWQRTIVQKLTTTFPNCQFIATTHSPLIVGEVPPENIILLEDGQPPFRPDQSLGMDTDWILKYLMGATTRNLETENALKHIANLIETEDYDEALDAIDTLRNEIGEFPELVRLQTRIDRLQLLGE